MTVLLLIILPVVFVMAVWVIVTAYRVLQPEPTIPIERDIYVQRLNRIVKREHAVAVGARDIREEQRRRVIDLIEHSEYEYFFGYSSGLPPAWWDDILERQN